MHKPSRSWCGFLFFFPYCNIRGNTKEVQRRIVFIVVIFSMFEMIIFYFVIAIFDLVHDVEAILHLPYLQTASGYLF